MREYETIYVTKPGITSEAQAKLQEKLQGALEKAEAKLLHQVDWGKRKLAYEVQKEKIGRYFYLSYLSDSNVASELERLLKYDDQVLKFLSVQVADQVNAEERLQKPGEPPSPPEEPSRYESRAPQEGGPRQGRGFSRDRETPAKAESSPKKESGQASEGSS